MRKFLLLAALAATLTAGAQQPYKVILPTSPEAEGAMARLMNFDTSEIIDSVVVKDQAARFEGRIDESIIARVYYQGVRSPLFILEGGTISFGQKDKSPFGSMLNDQLRAVNAANRGLMEQYRSAGSDEARNAVYLRHAALRDSVIEANPDNALGYMFFIDKYGSQDLSLAQIDSLFARFPVFAGYEKAKDIHRTIATREATSVGKKYLDFTITEPDGKVQKLSDYVGNGKYTLVDFWASWCGPCIRQTKVLKEIREQYKDDPRLQFLGVAVWDKPEDTKEAIRKHELPWPCIIDAQSVPTALYGITGIPCIMIIGPDGTILSRDKQSDELKADVNAALKK